jgi:hypothetical protein
MSIPKEVILDLLPVYLAGEASPATRAWLEEYLALHPELADQVRRQQIDRFDEASPPPLPPELELCALQRTRRVMPLYAGCSASGWRSRRSLWLSSFRSPHSKFSFCRWTIRRSLGHAWLPEWRAGRRISCSGGGLDDQRMRDELEQSNPPSQEIPGGEGRTSRFGRKARKFPSGSAMQGPTCVGDSKRYRPSDFSRIRSPDPSRLRWCKWRCPSPSIRGRCPRRAKTERARCPATQVQKIHPERGLPDCYWELPWRAAHCHCPGHEQRQCRPAGVRGNGHWIRWLSPRPPDRPEWIRWTVRPRIAGLAEGEMKGQHHR